MTFNHLIYLASLHLDGLSLFKYLARDHPRILMYHRLVPFGAVYPGIREEIFLGQMRFLAKNFNIVSVEELVKLTRESKPLPKNVIALTFDDGYLDFYEIAFPILRGLGLPATIYVVTDFIDGDRWLWPDLIRASLEVLRNKGERLIEFGNLLLDINENGVEYCWNLAANYCFSLDNGNKLYLIGELSKLAGIDSPLKASSSYRPLNWEHLKEMLRHGISVGSHSCSHPILTKLSNKELKHEIFHSKERIEYILGSEVKGFCYPNGRSIDFDKKVVKSVIEAGYTYAASAYPSKRPLGDLHVVNRYSVNNEEADFKKTVYGLKFLGLSTRSVP